MQHKRSALVVLAAALVVGAGVALLSILSEPPPRPEPEPPMAPARLPDPPTLLFVPPPPTPAPAVALAPLSLPDGFPQRHAGFHLETVAEQEILAGITSYFVARYRSRDNQELSFRLLSLTHDSSPKFIEHFLDALTSSGSVAKVSDLAPAQGAGWEAASLYSRDQAGIFVASNPRVLIMISAPSPDKAKAFGLSLKLE